MKAIEAKSSSTQSPDSTRRQLLMGGTALGTVAAALGMLTDNAASAQSVPTSTLYFNVKDFGATGNGVDDDGPQLQAAINAAATATSTVGAVVYIPPGRYLCAQKLQFPSSSTSLSVSLLGDGRGVSVIEFTSPNTGFNFTFGGVNQRLTVSGLSLYARVANAGTALYAFWPYTPAAFPRAHIAELEIGQKDASLHFWNYGVKIDGGAGSVIRDVFFHGKLDGSSTAGIELIRSSDVSISNCRLYYGFAAINVGAGDASTYGCEGTVIRDTMMLHFYIGVRSVTDQIPGPPWISVSDCHMYAKYRGILLRNRLQACLSNNIIYQSDAQPLENFVAIECQARCDGAQIHNNFFYHVSQDRGSFGISYSGEFGQLNHNTGNMTPTVQLASGSSHCIVVGNRYTGTAAGLPVTDVGANNQAHLNFPTPSTP